MKRRQFLTAATSVTLIPGTQTTPYQDAEYVRTLATRLSTGLYDHGGIPILPSALRHAQHLQPAVTSTDRTLQAAASDTVTWAAWIAIDAGRFDMAERLGRLALALAERTANQEVQAAAYSALTQTNISHGRLDHAVMYAKRGLALSEITPGRRAWLNMRLGRALALVGGQEHAARDALTHAQSAAGGIPPSTDAADLASGIGEVLGDLRAFNDAYTSLDDALALSENHYPFVYGVALLRQAKAALNTTDPEFAADRMFGLARVAPLVSSSWMDKSVNELLTLSARWATVPEMRTAREQLSSIAPATHT